MKDVWFVRIKIILHILLGLFFGGCVAMVYVTSTQRFKDFVQEQIEHQFARDLKLRFQGKIDSIDWVSCRVQLSSISISSMDSVASSHQEQQWSLTTEKVTVQGSWLSFLWYRYFKLTLQLDHLIMMEMFEQAPQEIPGFLKQMFTALGSPWVLYEGISVHDGWIYLKRLKDGLYVQIPYVAHLQSSSAQSLKIQAYLRDGVVWYQDGMSIEQISGSFVGQSLYANLLETLRGDVQLSFVAHKGDVAIPGFFAGTMRSGYGEFSMKTEDGSIVIDPISIELRNQHCWCNMRVLATPDIFTYFKVPEIITNFSGFVGVDCSFDAYYLFETLQISVVLQDLLYHSKAIIPGGKFTIQEHDKKSCSGVFCMKDKDWLKIDIQVRDDGHSVHGQNLDNIELLQGWSILPAQATFDAMVDRSGHLQGSYKATLQHAITKQLHTISGSFDSSNGTVSSEGLFGSMSYRHVFSYEPELSFKSFQMFDAKKELVLDLTGDEVGSGIVTGSVDFSVIRMLVSDPFKISFAQEGSFVGSGVVKDGVLHLSLQTHFAHIRVPYVYNVIQDLQASCDIDLHQKKITVKDLMIQWYEGTMSCQRATFWFDTSFGCYALHAPIIFNQVMMSWQKGIYSQLSGRVLVSRYQDKQPYNVEGKLFLHKSEIRENILSAQFHEMIQQISEEKPQQSKIDNVVFDVAIVTHDPLMIKTSFMAAKAMVDVAIAGTLQKPKLSGMINLVDGVLHFPYKPINIVDGKIILVPEQPLDPLIDLTARGKLKRYNTAIHAWGSALDPHIQFESQPYLSEEQILTLLMLGVEDQSLGLMVPAFLTQKLQEIMFGPALSKTKLKLVFDKILQSFKYVRFLPQFTSHAERGGMRGIFEIDASERLHGKIDTNFSHLEDTKFDVDYDVTDDMTVRLQKDGPSTYGGEVEFSWSFS